MTQVCPHCYQPINLSLVVERCVPRSARSVADIKFLVRGKVEATDKEIYNALGFLTRYGRIERLGYGTYRRRLNGD
jgi:hypothetical protein